MSSGGRKLQDIFDSGTRQLELLEENQKKVLETSASAAVNACGRRESYVMRKMNALLNEEESKILSYTEGALETIRLAIEAEQGENQRFYASLTDSLRLSLKSLTEDIERVRNSLLQKSSNEAEHRIAVFKTNLQTTIAQLRSAGLSSAEDLQAHSHQRLLSFTLQLEELAEELTGKESTVASQLHAEFMVHAQSSREILDHQNKFFAEQTAHHIGLIETTARHLTADLQSQANEHESELEQAFKSAEERLRVSHQKVLSDSLQSRHELSSRLFEELQTGLESSRIELAGELNDFRSDSEDLLDQLDQSSSTSDFEVRDLAGTLSTQIEDALSNKLETARANRQAIESERASIMNKITDELQQVEKRFEQRLSDMSRECLARLSTLCLDAENSIVAAHDNCIREFQTMSEKTRNDMEQRAEKLLGELEDVGKTALRRIHEAAGETGEN